jgi:hypothetical protein
VKNVETLIEQALKSGSETAHWDFKQMFDPDSDSEWLEIIKDVVAMANSGGGVIVFGLLDNGFPVGCRVESVVGIDPAVLGDRLFKYTGVHFSDFCIIRCQKGDTPLCAIEVGTAEFPLAFQKVGNYAVGDNKQKTVFGQGTVYFRHGAKSEPGNSADFRAFVDRKIESMREAWFRNIRAVIEAPADSMVAVVPSIVRLSNSADAQPIRITHEQAVQMLQAPMVDQTHPYRQKEAIAAINARLRSGKLNSHDLLCIRRAHNIHRDLKYCYNMNWNSPRYSEAFVDWVIESIGKDPSFVEKARTTFSTLKDQRLAEGSTHAPA